MSGRRDSCSSKQGGPNKRRPQKPQQNEMRSPPSGNSPTAGMGAGGGNGGDRHQTRVGHAAVRPTARNPCRTLPIPLEPLKEGHRMDPQERIFIEAAERGDKHTVMRCLQGPTPVNVNCTNILGRSAIQIAVDNENVEIVELLLKQEGVKIGDALLYAVCEGVYRIVEMLIDHPSISREMLGSEWATHKRAESEETSDDYSPDVSPVILAAHCNQFEILQLLLSRGARIVKPHSLSCSCQRCKKETSEDSLRHSLLRIHTYRALSSPAWISLTSSDPVLTAFKLSWELDHLAMRENEFKDLYAELSEQCKKYACNLLDQCRSSEEVIAVLNKSVDPNYGQEDWNHDWCDDTADGDDEEDTATDEVNDKTNPSKQKLTLDRFKLALKYEQKQFVAHPHCQQLLASIWYEGIPGWRRRNFLTKVVIIISLICLLPLMALIYLLFPHSRLGRLVRTPFMKFMYHSVSFGVFLVLLILASTNVGSGEGDQKARQQQRGPPPTNLEWLIVAYVMGFVWGECKQLWEEGLKAYIRQWWNWLDFIMLSLYLCTLALRLVAYFHSQYPAKYGSSTLPRTMWPEADPTLVSEGVFAIANVFSFARIIYLFQANPQLGPLQISLGCMLIDIGKFFFIFFLVITSFACGLNQLYYFYSANGGGAIVATPDQGSVSNSTEAFNPIVPGMTGPTLQDGEFENAFDPSFVRLDTSFVTLFWTLFGIVALGVLEVKLRYIEGFGKLLFGLYNVAARILFLNMLIAMMSKSFNITVDHADREWKFARSKLWMGYFDDGSTLPPPFNLIISPKSVYYFLRRIKQIILCCFCGSIVKRKRTVSTSSTKTNHNGDVNNLVVNSERRKYKDVMRRLVSRFIHQWKKQLRQDGVSEDDLLEIKQDISSLRFELREDRKREEFQTSLLMDNLKRDIARLIGSSFAGGEGRVADGRGGGGGGGGGGANSGGGGGGGGTIGGATSGRRSNIGMSSSRNSSMERDEGSPAAAHSNCIPAYGGRGAGSFLSADEIKYLRREIVSNLRGELHELVRDMVAVYSGRHVPPTPISPVNPTTSLISTPLNTELYQTHMYTQL